MFAREVVLQLKPNVVNELPVTFEKEILPLLRRQKGFLDELLLVTPEKRELEAISLWETKEYAETYNRELYPQIEKIMARFIEGIPWGKKFEAGKWTGGERSPLFFCSNPGGPSWKSSQSAHTLIIGVWVIARFVLRALRLNNAVNLATVDTTDLAIGPAHHFDASPGRKAKTVQPS